MSCLLLLFILHIVHGNSSPGAVRTGSPLPFNSAYNTLFVYSSLFLYTYFYKGTVLFQIGQEWLSPSSYCPGILKAVSFCRWHLTSHTEREDSLGEMFSISKYLKVARNWKNMRGVLLSSTSVCRIFRKKALRKKIMKWETVCVKDKLFKN